MKKIILVFILLAISFCNLDKGQKQLAFIEAKPIDPFEKIATTISDKVSQPTLRIVVFPMVKQDGREHIMGSVFAEKLTTELVKQKKLTVLDRFIYSKKLKEANLEFKGDYDLVFLKKISDVLGVEAVVSGIISPSGKYGYDLNCRLIDVKTGLILSAEEAYYTEPTE